MFRYRHCELCEAIQRPRHSEFVPVASTPEWVNLNFFLCSFCDQKEPKVSGWQRSLHEFMLDTWFSRHCHPEPRDSSSKIPWKFYKERSKIKQKVPHSHFITKLPFVPIPVILPLCISSQKKKITRRISSIIAPRLLPTANISKVVGSRFLISDIPPNSPGGKKFSGIFSES